MEINKLKNGLVLLNISEAEKELLNELANGLLMKLANENSETLLLRLFPEAILDEGWEKEGRSGVAAAYVALRPRLAAP